MGWLILRAVARDPGPVCSTRRHRVSSGKGRSDSRARGLSLGRLEAIAETARESGSGARGATGLPKGLSACVLRIQESLPCVLVPVRGRRKSILSSGGGLGQRRGRDGSAEERIAFLFGGDPDCELEVSDLSAIQNLDSLCSRSSVEVLGTETLQSVSSKLSTYRSGWVHLEVTKIAHATKDGLKVSTVAHP